MLPSWRLGTQRNAAGQESKSLGQHGDRDGTSSYEQAKEHPFDYFSKLLAMQASRRTTLKAGVASLIASAIGVSEVRFAARAAADPYCHAVKTYAELQSCQNVIQQFPSTFNGCGPDPTCGCPTSPTPIPQGYKRVSFTDCCNAHDVCYGTCRQPRADCDTNILTCLQNACTARYPHGHN